MNEAIGGKPVLELSSKYYSIQEVIVEKTELVLTTKFDSKKTYINLPYNNLRKITAIEADKRTLFGKKHMNGLYMDFIKVDAPVLLLDGEVKDYEQQKAILLDFIKKFRLNYLSDVTPVKFKAPPPK